MKVIASKLLIGQAFKLDDGVYIPLVASGSKIVAINSDLVKLLPYNMIVETTGTQLNGKDLQNENI